MIVRTPSRLHFGLTSFGRSDGPLWGGVGVMVSPPEASIEVSPADRFRATGKMADRVESFARRAADYWNLEELPRCHIHVTAAPPDHVGLGTGTQLGLAVGLILSRFLELGEQSPAELAASVGRGKRSAVGTYGFAQGGMIVDGGKHDGQALGTLKRRIVLPQQWRFVLARRHEVTGLSGTSESRAFQELPPVPRRVSRQLRQSIDEELVPTAAAGDYHDFGNSLFHYGKLAGSCFAAIQGGPYASPEIAELISLIREHGEPGVGQSSWGPTVFALTECQAQAEDLAAYLRQRTRENPLHLTICEPNNVGAKVERKPIATRQWVSERV